MKNFIYTDEFVELREANPELDIVYVVDGEMYNSLEEVEEFEKLKVIAPIKEGECDFQWIVGRVFESPLSDRIIVEGTGYILEEDEIEEIAYCHPDILCPEERDIGLFGGIYIDEAERYFEKDYLIGGPYLVFYLED